MPGFFSWSLEWEKCRLNGRANTEPVLGTHMPGHYLCACLGDHRIRASSFNLRKNLTAEGTGMIWRRAELGVLLLVAPETYKLWATRNSHQHAGTHDTSCPCALRIPSGSLQRRRRRRCLSAAKGLLALVTWSRLPSLGTSLTCFLLVRAELQGSEEWRNGKLNCQATAGAPEWHKGISWGLYPDTASSGTSVSWTIPLVFPSMLCWTYIKCLGNKGTFCLFSQQAWSWEGQAGADTAAGVLIVTLAVKGQPNQDA